MCSCIANVRMYISDKNFRHDNACTYIACLVATGILLSTLVTDTHDSANFINDIFYRVKILLAVEHQR